jgi:hypothetical protein
MRAAPAACGMPAQLNWAFGGQTCNPPRLDLPVVLIVSFGGCLSPPWNHE